ncbi:MAG: hypothetical protein ABIQ27_12465 [Flavobacterium sp.]|uniref:hypothetical protein n=1 Tax=Flavobacterium sp. TaxID=239 RepID=UPI00326392D4
METIQLTRKELYDLVWSTSLSKLTQQYALSNDGIKKICKEFDIPIPDNGYWTKLKFNKAMGKERLNEDFDGVDKIVLTLRAEGSENSISQTPLVILSNLIKNDLKAPTKVSGRLSKPDKLTIQTQDYWAKEEKEGYYRDDSKIILPIRVGKSNKERGLRFMDALVKLIKYRGHSFIKKNFEFFVVIDEIEILLDLREATKRVPSTDRYSTSDYIPTGEFILKTGRYSRIKEWRDGKVKLEELLPNIVAKLEIDAQEEKKQKEASRLWRLQFDEEQRVKSEIKKRKEDEIAKFNKLLALSEQYNKAQLIRQYIEVKNQKAIKENNLNEEKQEWINWANDKADWYDPTINKRDDILDS